VRVRKVLQHTRATRRKSWAAETRKEN